MAKRHKNLINEDESYEELTSQGFEVIVMNDYQFRIKMPELTKDYYDWYHTSGTIVANRENRTPASIGKLAFTASQLANVIFHIEEERSFI